jgi:hypothetical protein
MCGFKSRLPRFGYKFFKFILGDVFWQVAERSKAPVLKTEVSERNRGSNPLLPF